MNLTLPPRSGLLSNRLSPTSRAPIRLGVGPETGSALNLRAACLWAGQTRPGSRVVAVLPDCMERYFTTELFSA